MILGIRPINDFAFRKVFGSADKLAPLISLLNAVLQPPIPIVKVVVLNPFNIQDFQDDKLSILDIKATDSAGAIYHIEVQLTVRQGLEQRVVFYGCELIVDQLKAGDDYASLRPVYSICILEDILWPEASKVHHTFRLTDSGSGRVLSEVLEIHTIELGRYNLQESDLPSASELDRWLYWLKHAHEYEAEQLKGLFPQPGFAEATDTLIRIAEITEDKSMYDAREKALRDERWKINSAYREGEAKGQLEGEARGEAKGKLEGKVEGEVKMICTLQELLHQPVSDASTLSALPLEQLSALADSLREQLRNRVGQ